MNLAIATRSIALRNLRVVAARARFGGAMKDRRLPRGGATSPTTFDARQCPDCACWTVDGACDCAVVA